MHAGAAPDGAHGARVTPVHLSAGFVFDSFEHARERFAGEDEGYLYTRNGNPTTEEVERRLADLEGGAEAILVASGQAATASALLGILQAGDRVLSSRRLYEGNRGLLVQNFGRLGIGVDFVDDASDLGEWERRIGPDTRVLFGEPIPNPKNDLLDLPALAAIAHRHGLPLVVDNTLATPYLLRPIEHGADVVVHSTSKFLAGHGSALGGVIVDAGTFDWAARPALFPHLNQEERSFGGRSWTEQHGRRALVSYTRDIVVSRLGPTPSPLNSFLLRQGVETLSLRVERHSANALAVARFLEGRPEVVSVDYSGLESSPSFALAQRLLPRGQGSVFSFTVAGGEAGAAAFIDAVELFSHMTHLGDVRSLVLHPASTTHAGRTPAERAAAGIHPGLLRLSIGIEDVDDLLRDLERGLAAVRARALPALAEV
ncbi:O-acetylhomoserine aminocarboxypropyltransferase [Rathayibacter sp. AY1C4]|uniref:O-acetylhomoserine aminocarboxypropyltransferase/cysteine synthase family protein n=1 Tax=Rathayibacter sp. AY1C4 TaxID=2080537 RepID=UPI000CE76C54|nr:PLP-dependent transferase [Rathayibacter sp. AY1C4]PPH21514.1 O-acetylhomoserine aminocarboxypropyltransferase [Rathayibacter sp. AY1C4]